MASFPGQKSTGAPLPNPVTGLAAAVVSAARVNLTWSTVSNATSYNVLRGGVLLGTTSAVSFADLTTSPNTAYTYTVQGVNGNGAGLASASVSVTTPPGQVTGLTAVPVGPSQINVNWSAQAGALTYTVFRNGVGVGTPSGITFADTGLAASTTYTYTVAANGTGGQGALSAPASATTQAASGSKIKWNPGHYAESDTVVTAGGGLPAIQAEINRINNLDNVLGYMVLISWSNLQQAAGVYTWTNLDAIINYLKTGLNRPKRYCIQVVAGAFNSTHASSTSGSFDTTFVPQYLQQNVSLYGQAGYRVAGVTTQPGEVSGWWGGDGNGNTYGAALWRPAVMTEWIKLHQAIGARYDADPMFECIYQGEDSFYQGTGSTNGSDYNDTTQLSNWQNFLQAQTVAFPTTNVCFSETFLQFQQNSVTLTNTITDGGFTNHPPLLAQTDSLGAVYRSAIHTWGTKTYTGQSGFGTLGDRRSTLRFVAEIQAPDQGFFINFGSPREDVKAGLDILEASHSFWAIVPSSIAATGTPIKYPCTFASVPSGLSGILATPWPLTSGKYDMVTNNGGVMTTVRGSTAVSFSNTPGITGTTMNVLVPLTPFNWWNGGTTSSSSNGTSQNYTDPGLGAWLNDPANALQNSTYPPGYP